jgi:hypothetical protein
MLKNKIIEGEMKCGVHSKKRVKIKLGANEGLEKILLEWFHHMCSVMCANANTLVSIATGMLLLDSVNKL